MVRRLFLVQLAVLAVVVRAEAGVHVWRGTVSDRFSNAANWDGGSPAGDPDAQLSFPAGARAEAVNDIPGLLVRSIAISGPVMISGSAITLRDGLIDDSATSPNVIACNIILSGPLLIHRSGEIYDSSNLTILGGISGAGDLTKSGGGRVAFAGTTPNTYAGATLVQEGELRLAKPDGIHAIPGSLTIRWIGASWGKPYVISPASEQIADSATVAIHHHGELQAGGHETIGPLVLENAASLQMGVGYSGSYPMTGRLIMKGDIELIGSLQPPSLLGSFALSGSRVMTFAAGHRGITFSSGLLGASTGDGVTVRGPDSVVAGLTGIGEYTGPTIVEGAKVSLTNWDSPVTVRGGTFGGQALSIDVESGRLGSAAALTHIRLSPSASVILDLREEHALIAHGPVDLAGATLSLTGAGAVSRGKVQMIVENRGASPTTGTFAGMPEGALVDDRFVISYTGGNGNDVTLTDAARFTSRTIFHIEPSRVAAGESAQVIAEVSTIGVTPPVTGNVTFLHGTNVVATAALDASRKATATITLPWGTHAITARYEGTAEIAPSQSQGTLHVSPPKPVITSVEPPAVTGGTEVDFVVRGAGFLDGATVSSDSFTYHVAQIISESELRVKLPVYDADVPFDMNVVVRQPNPCCVRSDPFTVAVTPRVKEPSPLAFETRQISAPVATGATAAWLGQNGPRPYAVATVDDDRDGLVRLPLREDLRDGIWTATDISTGRLMAGDRRGSVPHQTAIPSKMFLRDAAGNFSAGIVPVEYGASWDFLWVRPGVGAWYLQVNNGLLHDRDRTYNRLLVVDTARSEPLQGSPAVPAGVQKGDVWIGVDMSSNTFRWFAATLGSHLDEASGAGVLELDATSLYRENDGVVTATVVRREGTDGAVSARYATREDTAKAGVQYEPVSGVLEFGPGEVVKTITVPINDDHVWAPERPRFFLELFDPVGTTILGESSVPFLIQDDEEKPDLSIGDATIAEGDDGTRLATLPVTLSGAVSLPVNAQWGWSDEQTGAGQTLQPLVFAPYQTRATISVPVAANSRPGPNRTIRVFAQFADHASPDRQGKLTVIDDDFAALMISDATVNENAGTVSLSISLEEGGKPVTLSYATRAGSADGGADFTATSGRLQTSGRTSIAIPILNDSIGESAEWFSVVISGVEGARVLRGTAVVSITDDEPSTAAATVSAYGGSIDEGDSGTKTLLARIRLSKPATSPVTVSFETRDGTATAGVDYVAASGSLTFATGEKEKTIAIAILGDTDSEADEHFFVVLGTVSGATIERLSGELTIDDDDRARRRTSRH